MQLVGRLRDGYPNFKLNNPFPVQTKTALDWAALAGMARNYPRAKCANARLASAILCVSSFFL